MISLRIGKKSIPLWFRSFLYGYSSDEAFKDSLIKEGIQYVSDLFKDKSIYQLIFLADRWFNSPIDDKGKHHIWTTIEKLFHYKYKATYYENILYTKNKIKTNIVFSAIKSVSISNKMDDGELTEPWIFFTNGDVKRAVKDYSYRFGAIEFLFKDQKSNGFNLEKSNAKNLQAYSMMYTYINICILFLSCVGTYYTRHKGKYYSDVKIRYFSIVKGKHKRRLSIFQVGLTLFKRAFNSLKNIRIPFNFVITDV